MDLQVGMYARFKNPLGNRINKIVDIFGNSIYFPLLCDGKFYISKSDIINASFNITNIIRFGDLVVVDGVVYTVLKDYNHFYGELYIARIQDGLLRFTLISHLFSENKISSIVTKERFDNVKFDIL